jgi:hypothetical protein
MAIEVGVLPLVSIVRGHSTASVQKSRGKQRGVQGGKDVVGLMLLSAKL